MKLFYATFFPALAFQSDSFFWKGRKEEFIDAEAGKLGSFRFSDQGYEVKIASQFMSPERHWAQPITFGQAPGPFTCRRVSWGQKTYKYGEFDEIETAGSVIEFSYDDVRQVKIRLKEPYQDTFTEIRGNFGKDKELRRNEKSLFSLVFYKNYLIFNGWINDSYLKVGSHKIYYDEWDHGDEPDASRSFTVDNNEGVWWIPATETLDVFTGPAVRNFKSKGCTYDNNSNGYAGDLLSLEITNLGVKRVSPAPVPPPRPPIRAPVPPPRPLKRARVPPHRPPYRSYNAYNRAHVSPSPPPTPPLTPPPSPKGPIANIWG